MFQSLRRLHRLYKFLKSVDEICSEKLTESDIQNIAILYKDSKYESFVKLANNVIIDLQNKSFREAQAFEEFMGIKWARTVILLLQNEVKNKYFTSIKPSHGKTTPSPEDFEGFPDGEPVKG